MYRHEAKRIAQIITYEEICKMMVEARSKIKKWDERSKINPALSKGTAFNILTKGGLKKDMHILIKVNLIREYGEFLPENFKTKKKPKPNLNIIHQEPVELKYE